MQPSLIGKAKRSSPLYNEASVKRVFTLNPDTLASDRQVREKGGPRAESTRRLGADKQMEKEDAAVQYFIEEEEEESSESEFEALRTTKRHQISSGSTSSCCPSTDLKRGGRGKVKTLERRVCLVSKKSNRTKGVRKPEFNYFYEPLGNNGHPRKNGRAVKRGE